MPILGLEPSSKPTYPPHFDIENVIRPNILALDVRGTTIKKAFCLMRTRMPLDTLLLLDRVKTKMVMRMKIFQRN